MAILPLREFGSVGVVKDIDPYDLPPNAFNTGVNVRFANGTLQRGPVFRNIVDLDGNPQFIDGLTPLGGLDYIIVGYEDGTLDKITGSSTTTISPSGWTPTTASVQWTSTNLSDVYYTNREDRVPWYMARGGSEMADIPDWSSDWRCKSLRAFNGQLIAIGMSEEGIDYPTTVRWSDFTVAGSPPASWTPLTTNSAGRNTLAEMVNPLIDGVTLRSSMVLYSRDEVWAMEPTGDNNVYAFRRLFSNAGVINKNCVVEVDGRHYVFGFDDIFVHDGVNKQSISQGRVRQFIYQTLNKRFMSKFFVIHNRPLSEIMFCYVGGDPYTAFPALDGEACNRAAVYNYVSDTWTFYDLPWSTAAGVANLDTSLIWEDGDSSWELTGGSYADTDDGYKRNVMFVGLTDESTGLTRRIHVFEDYATGSTTKPVDTVATAPALAIRKGLDLDEIKAELRGFKQISSIYPEGRLFIDGAPLMFVFGTSIYPNEEPTYSESMSFNGIDQYKLDYRASGRYLAYQITYNDYKSFSISGMDVDLTITGSR